MRPSYVVLILVAAAVAGLAALGPLRGRSVESGFEDVGGAIRSAFSGFGGGTKKATAKAPTPELTVSQPIARKVIEWDEFTGRFAAVESVEVRARISGYLTEVMFTDGQDVKKGDLLFTIDPRPFERALDQAKAQLDQAKVSVSNAQLDVERGRPLVQRDYISKKTFDDRENLMREAESLVKIAEARVKAAELELSFCRITAPISGRMSRTLVTPGNFVSGGGSDTGSTILTTIVMQDPIYIYFDVSENNALKYQRMAQAGGKTARRHPRRRRRASACPTRPASRTTPSSTSSRTGWTKAPARCAPAPSSPTRTASSRPACSPACACRARPSTRR